MAKVIILGKAADETVRKIASTLEQDERDFVYLLTKVIDDTYEIDRCKSEDFSARKPGYGAKYFASIIYGFGANRDMYELAEHYYREKECSGTQINIFGYFKSVTNAAKNMVRFGNTTENGRKPIKVYK